VVRVAAALAAFAVVAGVSGAFAIHAWGEWRLERARAGLEATWGHLEPYSAPSPAPDHLNGARWLAAGGRAILCSPEDREFYRRLSARRVAGWTDAERSRARRILDEQRAALEILRHSADLSSFHLGADGERPNHHEIDFLGTIKGLRLLTLEARLAWSEDRREDSAIALRAIGRAADGLMGTPVLMASTTGAAAARWAAGAAADIATDPCAEAGDLEATLAALPRLDPVERCSTTLVLLVGEIGDEGMAYLDDLADPAMGWSLPFWISSRYLFEDLFVAEALDRWSRHLELFRQPAAGWPSDAVDSIWGDPSWPPWLALAGTITPNLVSLMAREQAAASELDQVRLALELRLASPNGLDDQACALAAGGPPTALTGEPVSCRVDRSVGVVVLEIVGAERALLEHTLSDSDAAVIPAIELPLGPRPPICDRDQRTRASDSQGQ
jgi:hypothetical protein